MTTVSQEYAATPSSQPDAPDMEPGAPPVRRTMVPPTITRIGPLTAVTTQTFIGVFSP